MATMLPPQNKLVQDAEVNEENRFPVYTFKQNKDRLYQGTEQSPQEHPEEKSCKKSLRISWRCY
jgi:hypothetical protein